MNSSDESQMIARCLKGDADAWDGIFHLHYPALCRFVFQLASDFTPEDVEEICQDTFILAIKNLGSFHKQSRLQTWLFRIAANKSKDYRERKNALKRGSGTPIISIHDVDNENGQLVDPPEPAPGPHQTLLNQECIDLLYQTISQLGSPCQELLELRYFGELEYAEIGHELDLHPKTVSSRLSRCMDRFKELARPIFSGGNRNSFPSNPYAV